MTLDNLMALWAARDLRYATRRHLRVFVPLSPTEAAAILAHREGEIERLPLPVQARARTELATWSPPGRLVDGH